MTDPTCRYCGAVMKFAEDFAEVLGGGYYECPECGSTSPFVADFEGDIRYAARVAALRRPVQMPMTHDELLEHLSAMHPYEIAPLYIEFHEEHDYDLDFASRWRDAYNLSTINAGQGEKYGKTWRCWRARPTDEERKAAKWEES